MKIMNYVDNMICKKVDQNNQENLVTMVNSHSWELI